MCNIMFSSNIFPRAIRVGWNKLKGFFPSAKSGFEMTQRVTTKSIYYLQFILANAIKARRNPGMSEHGVEATVLTPPKLARGSRVSECVLSRYWAA